VDNNQRFKLECIHVQEHTTSHRHSIKQHSPRVPVVAFRLLQLSSIRHLRHPAAALTGRTECCSTLAQWHPKVWPHSSGHRATTLVTSIRQRVEFKLAVLVYKALNNLAPPYLSDDCQLVATTGRRQLQSSDNLKCTITTSSRLGDRAFATAGPRLWNSLPTRCPSTSFVLGHLLPQSGNVFNSSRHQHSVTVAFRRCVQIFFLTYSLSNIRMWADAQLDSRPRAAVSTVAMSWSDRFTRKTHPYIIKHRAFSCHEGQVISI